MYKKSVFLFQLGENYKKTQNMSKSGSHPLVELVWNSPYIILVAEYNIFRLQSDTTPGAHITLNTRMNQEIILKFNTELCFAYYLDTHQIWFWYASFFKSYCAFGWYIQTDTGMPKRCCWAPRQTNLLHFYKYIFRIFFHNIFFYYIRDKKV